MHIVLSCEQVFDILTRGPFPMGDPSDEDVELHLQGCHECRQLAEALRPAVELFHESLAPDEEGDLPGYRGLLPAMVEGSRVTTLSVPDGRGPYTSTMRWWNALGTSGTLCRFAAGLVLGAAMCLLLWQLAVSQRPLLDLAGPSAVPVRFAPDHAAMQQLAELALPPICLAPLPRPGPSTANTQRVAPKATSAGHPHCCTRCHSQQKARALTLEHVALLTRSCGICHEG